MVVSCELTFLHQPPSHQERRRFGEVRVAFPPHPISLMPRSGLKPVEIPSCISQSHRATVGSTMDTNWVLPLNPFAE